MCVYGCTCARLCPTECQLANIFVNPGSTKPCNNAEELVPGFFLEALWVADHQTIPFYTCTHGVWLPRYELVCSRRLPTPARNTDRSERGRLSKWLVMTGRMTPLTMVPTASAPDVSWLCKRAAVDFELLPGHCRRSFLHAAQTNLAGASIMQRLAYGPCVSSSYPDNHRYVSMSASLIFGTTIGLAGLTSAMTCQLDR